MRNALTFSLAEGEDVLALKFAMLQRRWKAKDLATKAKLHVRVVHNLLAGNNRTWPPRAAINQALRLKIFTKPQPQSKVRQSHVTA